MKGSSLRQDMVGCIYGSGYDYTWEVSFPMIQRENDKLYVKAANGLLKDL